MTKNFNIDEFDCTDGSEMPTDVQLNIAELALQLEVLRAHFNAPIHINSGYRSLEYNRSIGSNDSSQHVLGKAADIVIKGVSPNEVADAIEFLIEVGLMKEGGLGYYDTFTHYDIRGTKARWDFRSK